jgi:hypothetical protein
VNACAKEYLSHERDPSSLWRVAITYSGQLETNDLVHVVGPIHMDDPDGVVANLAQELYRRGQAARRGRVRQVGSAGRCL